MTLLTLQIPTTLCEIDTLISDGVQENIHLDYKRSAAISDRNFDEIARDVSSFANSDGGVLIYGIQEKEHLPIRRDEDPDQSVHENDLL